MRSPSVCFALTAWKPTSRCCRAFSPPRASASKKTVRASEQDRPDVAERREAWRRAQKDLGGRLFFLPPPTGPTSSPRIAPRTSGHRPHGPGLAYFRAPFSVSLPPSAPPSVNDDDATRQRIRWFRNDSICATLNHLVAWSWSVAFQR